MASKELATIFSEHDVKVATLRYLKTYYKFRPRKDSRATVAQLDMVAPGGIVADGHLTYELEDDSTFLATFEATAKDTKDEVVAKVQEQLLFWDGLAFSGLITAAFFIYHYEMGTLGLKEMDMLTMIAFTWAVLLPILGLFRLVLSRFKRYHYIYAIEQFKQYHADEQWVSLAYDVFENPNDPKLNELKDQCVRYGFGLLIILPTLEALLVITPSRISTFRKRRQSLRFVNIRNISEQIGKRIPGKNLLARIRSSFSLVNLQNLSRFQQAYNLQIIVSSIASLAMLGLFIQKRRDAQIRFAEREEILEEQEVLLPNRATNPEPEYYKVDTLFLDQFVDFDKPYLFSDVSEEDLNERPAVAEAMRGGVMVLDNAEKIISYDCSRFLSNTGHHYILVDQAFLTESAAINRLQELRDVGLLSGIIWEACIDEDRRGFLVYLGLIYNSEIEAQVFQTKITLYLSRQEVTLGDVYIRKAQFRVPAGF